MRGAGEGHDVAFGTPALQWLNKKNPEAGALGAPVRRLILTERWVSGDGFGRAYNHKKPASSPAEE